MQVNKKSIYILIAWITNKIKLILILVYLHW